ncbi:MAG TPA: malectin domain-containing carbohydrate-binding protein, partial [Prosthecobacter sp.]|nr:malectin domain-containing carbohydrate-binding protein [Prosthecobacter sp.]
GADNPWVFTSGARGLEHAELPLIGKGQKPETYTVRLYFAAPEGDKPGQRVFDVRLQDKTVLKGLDVVAKAGGARMALMEEFQNVPVTGDLVLDLVPAQANADESQQPVLCGIEVLRTNAAEIRGGVAGTP